MSQSTDRRTRSSLLAGATIAGIAALSLVACGSEESADTAATPASSSPSSSVPVVGGPSPRPQSQSTTTHDASGSESTSAQSQTCGTVSGPDGALRVLILAGNVSCVTAKNIGGQYSPKIATGQQQQISGWTCGPSEVSGVLAACQSGDKVIGFTP